MDEAAVANCRSKPYRVMDTVVGQVTDIGHSSEEFWGSQSLRALWRKGF